MAINKVNYGGQTLIDTSEDTAEAGDVLSGKKFHSKSGSQSTGTLELPVKDVEVDGTSVVDSNGVAEINGTSTPTANRIAEFDSASHMNSADMSSQDVQDFIDDLDLNGINVSDYVIEQGVSGIWTYRKWKNGIAECWGSDFKNCTVNTAWGSIYEGQWGYEDYPDNLFIATPNLYTSFRHAGAAAFIEVSSGHSQTRTPLIYMTRPVSSGSSLSYGVSFYAIGKWK